MPEDAVPQGLPLADRLERILPSGRMCHVSCVPSLESSVLCGERCCPRRGHPARVGIVHVCVLESS